MPHLINYSELYDLASSYIETSNLTGQGSEQLYNLANDILFYNATLSQRIYFAAQLGYQYL